MADNTAGPSRSTALTTMGPPAAPGGERRPGISLNRQVVLEEDEYTAALSQIIRRDFFPHLNRLSATNDYLSALEAGDSVALTRSIRRLGAARDEAAAETPRRLEDLEALGDGGTPYVSRTPFGVAGMETPLPLERRVEGGNEAKRRRINMDRGLDDFQHAYTSEDNASFIDILHEENRLRRERHAWAYEAERKAKTDRLRLEQTRRVGLIQAGGYVPDDGIMPRLIRGGEGAGQPGEPTGRGLMIKGRAEAEVGADKGKMKAIEGAREHAAGLALVKAAANDSTALVQAPSQGLTVAHPATQVATLDPTQTQLTIPNALPIAEPIVIAPEEDLVETALDAADPLARALTAAGLPATAITDQAGTIVPVREVATGTAEDTIRRGEEERQRREAIEAGVLAAPKDTREKHVPAWGYRARNAFYFGPDADVSNLRPVALPPPEVGDLRQPQKEIKHANTRIPDEDEEEGGGAGGSRRSARGTSPSRSMVGAAISGTPYHPSRGGTMFNNYPLVPEAPSPSPEELGPQAVSQLMTWGTLLSTPRALNDAGEPIDLAPNHFKISEPQRRDAIGRKLATDASRAMRERAKGYGGAPRGLAVLSSERTKAPGSMGPPAGMTPSSSFAGTPRRSAASLTPAGKDLLRRTAMTPLSASRSGGLGLASAGSRSRGDAMERAGGWGDLGRRGKSGAERTWTPSPAHRRRGE